VIGQTVSHYRIVEQLGGGGMGVVYKAIDTRLNRFVALKFLSPTLTKDADANERFRQEAQAASALDHPNICTIHEIDETPDRELFLTMAYYDGETLKQRIERGPLGVNEALDIATQMARALSKAHEAGIVHRDVKPANAILSRDGLVKMLDFGLAKLAGHADITRTGTTLGTVAYMSPEQLRGMDIGARADVWSLGVVLYEMLAGRRPFVGSDDLAVITSIANDAPQPIATIRPDVPKALSQVISRCLDRNLTTRYPSGTEVLMDLVACGTAAAPAPAGVDAVRWLRRPIVAVPLGVIIIAAAVPAVMAYRRGDRARWAREEAIPQIQRLIQADDVRAAYALAEEALRVVPDDPSLATLLPQISAVATITTEPVGADVAVAPYAATDAPWQPLGRSPVANVRLPRGAFRMRIEKAGYDTRLLAVTNPGVMLQNLPRNPNLPQPSFTIPLTPEGTARETVAVLGGVFPVGLSGFNADFVVELDPFRIDRHEVTNQAFKRFIDTGGYEKAEYWRGLPFAGDGRSVTEADAIKAFRDSTGRPGPSQWELGTYPSGQDAYPVSGVSWFEAVAYCRSVGKVLPTVYHWARAAVSPIEIGQPLAPVIIPASNLESKGPRTVETTAGIGPYGTYDMQGNVREWVWNESSSGRRWILGGAWNDPPHLSVVPNSLPPFDRSATNGFRCAEFDASRMPESVVARIEIYSRDYRALRAVSDEVYEVFKRQYSYEPSPLNDRVDAKDTSNPGWIRETISFDTGYENGRTTVNLFLPRNVKPPYQLVVLFPGLGPFVGRGVPGAPPPGTDWLTQGGRAVAMPVYKGSFERWDDFLTRQGQPYLRTMRQRMAEWRQDIGRTIDVMTQRQDIDATRIVYMGGSFGASTALPLLALESRFKTAVLLSPGFTFRLMPPEADAINYVSHITMPVLMIGGRHDYVMPVELSQKPLFERLGTPADRKKHIVTESGHSDFPRSELIRDVLGWLDRYLGPVN
jgi:formylglycine-generating enzyme required for sulfatase activity/dienelactone hydrolase